MKEIRHISVLLLVNISIMIGHNLVPHHHHVSAFTHPSSEECQFTHECPASAHDHHDEDSDPEYCHAFNNMVFVKDSPSQLPVPEKLSSLMMVLAPGMPPEPNTGFHIAPGYFLKQPILSPGLAGMLSLRGPPVLS